MRRQLVDAGSRARHRSDSTVGVRLERSCSPRCRRRPPRSRRTCRCRSRRAGLGSQAFSLTGERRDRLRDRRLAVHRWSLGGRGVAAPAGRPRGAVVDHVVYVQLPGLDRRLLGARRRRQWLDRRRSSAAVVELVLRASAQSDPTQVLASLETVSDDVDKVGTDDGARRRHDALPRDDRPRGRRSIRPMSRSRCAKPRSSSSARTAVEAPSIPVDVWIDADGHVRRMIARPRPRGVRGGARRVGGSGSAPAVDPMSIDLYDFGVPVDVQAPPADQIVSAHRTSGSTRRAARRPLAAG